MELEAERATFELKPPEVVVVIVEVGDAPWVLLTVAESEDGEALIAKSAVVCEEPVRAAIRPVFGLPQPVTRSKPATAE